jgi:arylsulfatase A
MPGTTTGPNVILINCDDLGYGDLGCYGSELNQTPALDRMAAQGMRCTSFYAASPVCSPSRGALLTGCYPPRIGFGSFNGLPVLFPGHGVGLSTEETTIAGMLRDAGYRTQIIGKWHCGDQPEFLPTRHGFEHYFGIPFSNDMGRQVNTPKILPEQHPLPLLLDEDVIEQQPDQASLTERYVTEALRFLCAPDDRPFFLYFAHMYVHLPIYVQERFVQQSQNGRYGAAVECIDWVTDVLLHELDRLGVADKTIVMFTSDNGSLGNNPPPWGSPEPIGASNGPLRGTKGTTFDGGQRVPFIIRWPGQIPAGTINDQVCSAIDVLPTLASICGGTMPVHRIDGLDLSAMWFDPSEATPRESFVFYRMNDIEAVRVGRWKLHVARRGQPIDELYDLDADIGETTNVFDEQPSVVAQLRLVVESTRALLGDARLGIEGSDVRSIGRVDDPEPLTKFDPTHPYYLAEYDLADRG